MKKRDLEKALTDLGWWLKRQGGGHEIWTNGRRNGTCSEVQRNKRAFSEKNYKQSKKQPS